VRPVVNVVGPGSEGHLSFAKTPSGGQVVDRSALIMPRSNTSGRRSPCLHGVDPRDNSTASRQIPFPIRSPASRWPLRGTGDTARAAEGHSHQPADASRIPGPGQGLRISVGDRPVTLILPSAPRQFGQSGDLRPGGSRSKTSPAGVGGRGGRRLEAIPPLLRAMKDQRLVRPDGVLAKDNPEVEWEA
jgi:hypothetical protein